MLPAASALLHPKRSWAGLATNAVDTAADLIGCFSYTTLIRNRPRTLTTWRVTATGTGTARRIPQLLAGHPQRNPGDNGAEVITASTAVDVLLDPHMLTGLLTVGTSPRRDAQRSA